MQQIEDRVCIPMESPLIKDGPRLCRPRTPATVLSIRCSTRQAAKPRAANATLQAQAVLMQNLGVAPKLPPTDMEAVHQYFSTFAGPLTPSKEEALQVLFSRDFDPVAWNLNLAELDGEEL
jgi:hypothetical protein